MKKARLLLLVLALTVASGLSVQKAQAFVVCHDITNCETNCEPKLENCYAGTFHVECGGDVTCCNNAFAACFQCCVWP
jgi:hypothetical protein